MAHGTLHAVFRHAESQKLTYGDGLLESEFGAFRVRAFGVNVHRQIASSTSMADTNLEPRNKREWR